MIEWKTLLRRLDGPLPERDEAEFRAWIDSDPGHKAYFERLAKQWDDTSPSPTRLDEVIGEFDRFVEYRRRRTKRRRLAIASVAAACCLFGALTFMYTRSGGEDALVMEIIPGENRGLTIIADGEVINVDDLAGDHAITVAGAEIVKNEKYIRYDTNDNTSPTSNTIAVPRGGEWNVVLPDGTAVKLNADSKITFLSAFSGPERIVELSGEAFFTVTPDKDKPFIVATDLGRTRVYGTMFNIKQYDDDSDVRITLVEGSLGFTSKAEAVEVMLEPNQRIVYDGTGTPAAEPAKVEVDIAWTKAQFSFEHTSLNEITRTISKWYDVEFVFEDPELAKLTFTGRLNRYEKLGSFLRLFEQAMNIEFTVKGGNTIVIRRR